MTEAPITADASTEVTICRQPIFDAHRRLWGYELLCVGEPLPSARTCDLQDTALQVAASASMDVQRILHQGQVIMLNFDEIDILKKLPYALPPKLAAIQVDEQIFLKPSIPEQLASLKSDGYLIAVRGFSAEQHFSALYALADIIAVPVNYHQKTQIAELLSAIGNMDARLLARRVDDLSRFESCREAGVALFSGTFFKHPDTVTIHQMTANEVSRLKLIQRMEATDPDIDGLAETLQADAAISFRLMAYLNSAAFGFSQKIKSVQHAIRLLGWPKLKNWLRVVVLSDMGQSPEADELLQLSAQRARFLERVAQRHDFWGFDPASLHLLGLFFPAEYHPGHPHGGGGPLPAHRKQAQACPVRGYQYRISPAAPAGPGHGRGPLGRRRGHEPKPQPQARRSIGGIQRSHGMGGPDGGRR